MDSYTCVPWQIPSGILFSSLSTWKTPMYLSRLRPNPFSSAKFFSNLLSRCYPLYTMPLSTLFICSVWSLSQKTILLYSFIFYMFLFLSPGQGLLWSRVWMLKPFLSSVCSPQKQLNKCPLSGLETMCYDWDHRTVDTIKIVAFSNSWG